ncbi:tRNA pseudouridine(13) synthase TruD [Streptomyces lavendulocolor]|uniref:tRNA pseudouridine(13) synthase TruD n=1 Tax=Streptomyces lavendulocolor TaxID=67316 RepID=UPI0034109CBE
MPLPRYVLKYRPEDFCVTEVSRPVGGQGPWAYAHLEKCGITTFEALARVAEHLGLAEEQACAGGLKDEDGVTRQSVSLRGGRLEPLDLDLGEGRWLRLGEPYGWSDRPLAKGALIGNDFRLVIRRLPKKLVRRLCVRGGTRGQFRHFVANYFDRQRFGVPGSDYRTAEVGAAVLAGDLSRAGAVLYKDSVLALSRGGLVPQEQCRFVASVDEGRDMVAAFEEISPRLRRLFLAAHYAREWNHVLSLAVSATGEGVRLHSKGHPLDSCLGLASRTALTHLPAALPLQEPEGDAEGAARGGRRETWRPTVQAVKFFVLDHGPDPFFPGNEQLTVFFHLPSGSYATTAVHQVLVDAAGSSGARR